MKSQVFTGERIIPELDNYFFYEHLARYKLASRYIKSETTLLDVGSGDGYGTFFLSFVVKEAVGIDIASETIELANERYQRDNLRYQLVQNDDWRLAQPRFDVVTCFEVFEHVTDPDQLMIRIADQLPDGGLVILSTPNKDVYGENLPDPYHVKEYSLEEFKEIVGRHFVVRQVFGQRNKNSKAKKLNFWLARQAMRFPIILRFVNWTLARKGKKHLEPGYFDRFDMRGNYFSETDAHAADYFIIVAEKSRMAVPG